MKRCEAKVLRRRIQYGVDRHCSVALPVLLSSSFSFFVPPAVLEARLHGMKRRPSSHKPVVYTRLDGVNRRWRILLRLRRGTPASAWPKHPLANPQQTKTVLLRELVELAVESAGDVSPEDRLALGRE